MRTVPQDLQAARDQWQWRGRSRPAFAEVPGLGQVSAWDFPRPPVIAPDAREIVIRWGSIEVARTCRAVSVLETSHPPSFYLPWADVAQHLLRLEPVSGSFCEWKGPAQYWRPQAGGFYGGWITAELVGPFKGEPGSAGW